MALRATNPYARKPRLTATVTSRTAIPGQPQQTFAQQVMGKPPPSAPRPNLTQNARTGQNYRVLPAPGGSWHLYPNGAKVFVKAQSQPPTTIPGTPDQPAVDPGGQLAPDSQYIDDRAQGLFKIRQQLDGNDAEKTANELALRESIRALEQQRPADERNTRQAANKAGLFYSSELTRGLQDVATNYVKAQAGAQGDFSAKESARLSNRQAIEAGYTLGDPADLEASAGRQITRDTTAADAGYLVPEYGTPGTPARTVGGRAAPPTKYRTYKNKAGETLHYYPTTKRRVNVTRGRRR